MSNVVLLRPVGEHLALRRRERLLEQLGKGVPADVLIERSVSAGVITWRIAGGVVELTFTPEQMREMAEEFREDADDAEELARKLEGER